MAFATGVAVKPNTFFSRNSIHDGNPGTTSGGTLSRSTMIRRKKTTTSGHSTKIFARSSADIELFPVLLKAAAARQREQLNDILQGAGQAFSTLKSVSTPTSNSYPPGPEGDSALDIVGDPVKFSMEISSKYGGVAGLRLAGQDVVLVTDPVVAKDVMIDRPELFQKEGTAFFPNSSLAGNGLLVSDGDVWRRQRQLSNPAFRKKAVDSYGAAMAEATRCMLRDRWQGGGVRDVYADFNDLSLTIVTQALFGLSQQEDGARLRDVNAAIADAFEFFGRRAAGGVAVPEWVPTPENLRFLAAVQRLDDLVYDVIATRRARVAAAERLGEREKELVVAEGGLLNWLLAAKDEVDGSGMSDQYLRDEMNTLIIAGAETTGITLTWTCTLLAQHPEVMRKIAEEVSDTLGPDRLPNANDYPSLQYTQAVILEVLRMLPPAYMVGRCCAEDVEIAGYQLGAGTTVLISPYVIHRDGQYWDRPHDFDPDRFLTEEGTVQAKALNGMGPNGAYIPFGAGPRKCIGTGFAMMEAVLVVATIARDYQVSIPRGSPIPEPRPLITLRPKGLVELQISPKMS